MRSFCCNAEIEETMNDKSGKIDLKCTDCENYLALGDCFEDDIFN